MSQTVCRVPVDMFTVRLDAKAFYSSACCVCTNALFLVETMVSEFQFHLTEALEFAYFFSAPLQIIITTGLIIHKNLSILAAKAPVGSLHL